MWRPTTWNLVAAAAELGLPKDWWPGLGLRPAGSAARRAGAQPSPRKLRTARATPPYADGASVAVRTVGSAGQMALVEISC